MNFDTKIVFNWISFVVRSRLEFVLCALVLITFAASSYPISIFSHHSYLPGDVSVRDVKASVGFCVEDEEVTDALKDEVLSGIPVVYDFDSSVEECVISKLESAFNTQRNFQFGIESVVLEKEKSDLGEDNDSEVHSFEEIFLQRKKLFVEEIGINVSDASYKLLNEYKFAEYIPRIISLVISKIFSNGVIIDKEKLLAQSYRGIILRHVGDASEERVWDLKTFYSLGQAKSMVRIIGDPLLKDLNYAVLNLIVDFSQQLINANIIPNVDQTNRRKELALEAVVPKLYFVKSGEMILREGEIVDRSHLIKLKALEERLWDCWPPVAGAVLIILSVLVVYYFVQLKPGIKSKKFVKKDLIFLTVVLLTTLILVRIWVSFPSMWYFSIPLNEVNASSIKFGVPLSAGAMIVCLVLGTEIAFPFALLSVLITSMLLPNKFEHCVYFFLSAIIAVWWVENCRERGSIIRVGAKLGLFCALIAAAIDVYVFRSLLFYPLFFDIIVAFIGGISSGILVVGVLPVVEIMFKYTTDITLLELSNLDRPILRRLMLEAPGTYHHSVVVGSMVEAAASEIGANSLLAKVCGYYHDIGKLRQPLYFVENQLDRRNKHDKLSPSMSSLVLIAHVKHGIDIAKKYDLSSIIIDVIRQHHGNSLISYFFEKAKQIKGEENINISDFRYPGPTPQTVEAGLVMLADVVEAASRALANPTSSRIQGLVQNLINKIFSDSQLNNCNLTLKDLNSIAKSFNKILNGIHHHRVEYQNSAYAGSNLGEKSNNAYTSGQQTESTADTGTKNLSGSSNHLKRLGLS